MMQLAASLCVGLMTATAARCGDDAPAKRAEALVAQMINPKASWEDRCAAEDELAKLKPEVVLPKLLRHAAMKMPAGGIYNSAGRGSEKTYPLPWQFWYALGRSWRDQINRLPQDTGGELLVELLALTTTDAERNLVVPNVAYRWSPKAEQPLAKLLRDPAADLHLRVAAAWPLVQHGKQSYQDDLLNIVERTAVADQHRWFEVLCSQRCKKKTGIDPRVVTRCFALLDLEDQLYKKEVAKRPDAFHGAYFVTNWLADYLGEKFQPNADDPRYNNEGRRDPRWFADTVANALTWWMRNRQRFADKSQKESALKQNGK